MSRVVALLVFLAVVLLPTAATAGTITFDTDASGHPLSAPSVFSRTKPLTDLYAPLGVHFRGPKAGLGGAILNRQGNFGVRARSGPNFLAFNKIDTYARDPEVIKFDSSQRRVLIFAGSGNAPLRTISMTGFLGNQLVGRATVQVSERKYGRLKIVSDTGINRVRIKGGRYADAFVLDDLRFSPLA